MEGEWRVKRESRIVWLNQTNQMNQFPESRSAILWSRVLFSQTCGPSMRSRANIVVPQPSKKHRAVGDICRK